MNSVEDEANERDMGAMGMLRLLVAMAVILRGSRRSVLDMVVAARCFFWCRVIERGSCSNEMALKCDSSRHVLATRPSSSDPEPVVPTCGEIRRAGDHMYCMQGVVRFNGRPQAHAPRRCTSLPCAMLTGISLRARAQDQLLCAVWSASSSVPKSAICSVRRLHGGGHDHAVHLRAELAPTLIAELRMRLVAWTVPLRGTDPPDQA